MTTTKRSVIATSGSYLVVISSVFFATYGIWSKIMSGAFGEFTQAWTRGFILAVTLIIFGMVTKKFKKVHMKDIKWFAVIAFAGGLNQAPYFYGFQHVAVGTATLLFYIMLVLGTYVFGMLFFQEKLTLSKAAAFCLAVGGLSILYQFIITREQILPALATMLAGILGACGVVFSKKLSHQYSETQILSTIFLV